MKRAFFFGLIATICGLTAALLISLFMFTFNSNFYLWAMDNAGVYEQAGTDRPSISFVVEDLVSYLRGSDIKFDRKIVIDGELRAEFNAREVTHMADVRRLFRLAQYACAVVLLITVVFAVLSWKARQPRAVGWGLISGTLLLIAFGTFVYVQSRNETAFFSMFYRFHELLFTNDLWLLDPRTDLLIRLMPTQFFMLFAAAVGGVWALCVAAATAFGVWLAVRKRFSLRINP